MRFKSCSRGDASPHDCLRYGQHSIHERTSAAKGMNTFWRMKLGFAFGPIVLAAILSGCGGGAGAGSSSGGGSSSVGNSLSAYVADGPVSNANCSLYDANLNVVTASAVASSASSNGLVTFTGIPSIGYQGHWMLVQCAGGTYLDEATGKTINLPTTHVQEALFQFTANSTATVVVTPLTSIASEITSSRGIITDYPFQLRQTAILLGLGNVDISSVQPTDVNVKSADASIAGQYGIVLAMLSEMMKDKPATYPDLATLISTISTNIVGGALGDAVQADMLAALNNYSNNPLNQFVGKALIATNSPLFLDLSTGNAGATLSTTPNYASMTVTANTTTTGISYGMPITATGGTPPYHYQLDTLLNGSPPLGLSVNLVTGELNGTPTVPGNYHFGVCAVDLVGATSCSQVQMTVVAATTGAPPTPSTYYWANWSCGSSSQCASDMGAYTGSAGPMCTLNDCTAWGNKYIGGGYACSTTAIYATTTGSPSNGVCYQSGVDFARPIENRTRKY